MYTAWSVVFGEQPTAAKWNQLGENDAGFKDGTNFDDSIIDSRHYVDNSIDAEHLATNAILLGKTDLATSSSTSGSGDTEVSGFATAVTIPAGGRQIEVMATGTLQHSGTGNIVIKLWEGNVGAGTCLQIAYHNISASGGLATFCMRRVYTPSAGAKTYRMSAQVSSSTASIRGANPVGSDIGSVMTVKAV